MTLKRVFSYLKARHYARYTHTLEPGRNRGRSEFFAEWIDVGFLRHWWTNDGIIADGVFRSNNPDDKRYKEYAAKGVRTVVNLRHDIGRSPVALSRERVRASGMQFVSFPMEARRAPTRQELLDLMDLFPKLEKPILFHCKSGADRTGLVGAIWKLVVDGEALETAREELSLRYLHRRDSETGALDEVLDAYAPYEGKKSFKQWVAEDYEAACADTLANEKRPHRSVWSELRSVGRDLYRYAQYREALWHQSFAKPIETEEDRRRSNLFINWIDHGILRGIWTNFHQIGDGVFRSNHPTEHRFRKYAQKGFKTILNLRGASMEPQYQLEKALCQELDLHLIDLPMNAREAPPKDTVLRLLEIFDTAERPLIIHCKSGADRTGLAAALFKLHDGQGIKSARRQFSLRFIHFKNGPKGILDSVLDAYEADTVESPQSLREWVSSKYDPAKVVQHFKQRRNA